MLPNKDVLSTQPEFSVHHLKNSDFQLTESILKGNNVFFFYKLTVVFWTWIILKLKSLIRFKENFSTGSFAA